MSSIIYKVLFELQVLHEYYLTNDDETNIFDNINGKDIFLNNCFSKGLPSISDALLYQPPPATQSIFNNYHLLLRPTYAGFLVMVEVKEKRQPNGATAYIPLIKLPEQANLLVQLSPKNNLLNAVTNKRINKNIPSTYYFTNEDIVGEKVYPVLSEHITAFDASYAYEQGEIYTAQNGNICQYYLNGSNPDFLPVNGNGYANTNDELIVPLYFDYQFNATGNVTKASFILTDAAGNQIRSIEFKADEPFQRKRIDFRNSQSANITLVEAEIKSLPLSTVSAENIYNLNVSINDTKPLQHKLIFFDGDNALNNCWGIVNIKPVTNNPDFSLYDADGSIRYRKNADATFVPAPVFEIRVKSRSCFWRYINDRQGKLKADISPVFLQREGTNNLASILPRSASASPKKFTIKDNNGKITKNQFLPNPETDGQITIEGQKIFTNIPVPQSALFPLDSS